MSPPAISKTSLPSLTLVSRGKVRDIYSVPGYDDRLLFVATDRVSALDFVMKTPVPSKGSLLTLLSLHFFTTICPSVPIPTHVVNFLPSPSSTVLPNPYPQLEQFPKEVLEYREQLEGRTIWVKKCEVLKVEAIVRGYLAGSAWAEYSKNGTVNGVKLPAGLKESSKLPEPMFTPSTKADQGEHDVNIHPDEMAALLPDSTLAPKVQEAAISLYRHASTYCQSRGLLLCDTKFEFGLDHSTSPPTLTLVDECLTPDSSRFWKADEWAEGKKMGGMDKEELRRWLKEREGGPGEVELPDRVVESMRERYKEAFEKLVGKPFLELKKN